MKTVIDSHYEALSAFLAQIPQRMDAGEGEVVYHHRNLVARFRHSNGLSFMAKRFKRVNMVQRVVYTYFRKTKAERAFLFAEEFQRRGIETAHSAAYMERYEQGLFTVGYYISKESAGENTFLLLNEQQHFSHELADAVARQVVLMHSRGVLHGDLNLSNFLCRKEADGYHFTMIDINRSHFCDGMPADKTCLKNLVRITHRRDLYAYLIGSYAQQRGWNVDDTLQQALQLLDKFEHRRFRL